MVWIIGLWSGNHLPPIASGVFRVNDGPSIKSNLMIYAAANCYLVAKRRHRFRFREIKPVNRDIYFPPPFEKYTEVRLPVFSLTCISA